MKKILLTVFAIGLLSVSVTRAQGTYDAGQLAINAGFSYGFDIEELGLRAGATYFLNENMRVGGDLTYWLTGSHEGLKSTFLEVNGNFNYIFYDQDNLMFYGIGALGIHYAKVSLDLGAWGEVSESDTDVGVGIGIGGEYNLGPVSVFAEPKFFLAGFDQLKFNFGIRFYL